MAKRFRNVVFTINNPSAEDDKLLLEAALDKSITSYVCIGEEVGESGTKHYQGYWEFAGKMLKVVWMLSIVYAFKTSLKVLSKLIPLSVLNRLSNTLTPNNGY